MKDDLIDDVGFNIRCVMVQSFSVQDLKLLSNLNEGYTVNSY